MECAFFVVKIFASMKSAERMAMLFNSKRLWLTMSGYQYCLDVPGPRHERQQYNEWRSEGPAVSVAGEESHNIGGLVNPGIAHLVNSACL
jgi:hypothetical protein